MTDNEVRLECLKLVTLHKAADYNTVAMAKKLAEFVLDPNCCKED
jgi:hypothetical protein